MPQEVVRPIGEEVTFRTSEGERHLLMVLLPAVAFKIFPHYHEAKLVAGDQLFVTIALATTHAER